MTEYKETKARLKKLCQAERLKFVEAVLDDDTIIAERVKNCIILNTNFFGFEYEAVTV